MTWMTRLEAALAAGECSTQAEWVAKYPGKHCWFVFSDDRPHWESCACCGVVRRNDDKNKPCRGIVTIGLR
jgi:hypothetical protein